MVQCCVLNRTPTSSLKGSGNVRKEGKIEPRSWTIKIHAITKGRTHCGLHKEVFFMFCFVYFYFLLQGEVTRTEGRYKGMGWWVGLENMMWNSQKKINKFKNKRIHSIKKTSSRHDRAIAFTNLQQWWLPAQNLFKTGLIKTQSEVKEELVRAHSRQRDYWQLMVVVSEADVIFFSGVANEKWLWSRK